MRCGVTNHVTFGASYRFGAAPRALSALSRLPTACPKARRLRQTLRDNGAVHKRPVSSLYAVEAGLRRIQGPAPFTSPLNLL